MWLGVLLAATALGLLEASRSLVVSRQLEHPPPWYAVMRQNMVWWYVWAALTPLVAALSRRYPVTAPGRRVRHVLVHAAAGLTIGSVHLWTTASLWFLLLDAAWRESRPLGALIANWQTGFIVTNLITYAMIAGAFHAIEAMRRYDESRVERARLAGQAAELQRAMTEARLGALQKELNPHFLFNSLNAVSGLVRQHENDRAVTLLARLGDMLRVTLDRDLPTELPLDQELELLGHYLSVEQSRLGDRLAISMHVPPALRPALVPTLILQPLVENAIRHGIGRRAEGGSVRLSASNREGKLVLEVWDSGPGVAEAALSSNGHGVGLTNTRDRLAARYGTSAVLSLDNAAEGGAIVTVRLPLVITESALMDAASLPTRLDSGATPRDESA